MPLMATAQEDRIPVPFNTLFRLVVGHRAESGTKIAASSRLAVWARPALLLLPKTTQWPCIDGEFDDREICLHSARHSACVRRHSYSFSDMEALTSLKVESFTLFINGGVTLR